MQCGLQKEKTEEVIDVNLKEQLAKANCLAPILENNAKCKVDS